MFNVANDSKLRGCEEGGTIKRIDLEIIVLDALRTRLMALEVYASFVRGFTSEWNAEQG